MKHADLLGPPLRWSSGGGRVGNKKALTWDKFKDAHMTFKTRISDMQ